MTYTKLHIFKVHNVRGFDMRMYSRNSPHNKDSERAGAIDASCSFVNPSSDSWDGR